MLRFITDRIRVFAFGIVIAVVALWNPGLALRWAYEALDR